MDYFVWDASPEIFSIGFFTPRWYGLMFAVGFYVGMKIMESFVRAEKGNVEEVSDLLFWTIIATVVGARLGHVLFYQPDYYIQHPLEIVMIWKGGLASHGGFFAVILSWYLYSRKKTSSYSFLQTCDRAAVPTIMVAGLIRIGNFFNSEIIGRATDVPWAIVFKRVDLVPRHPTQLYESASYFAVFVLSYILFTKTDMKKKPGQIMGLIMGLAFIARFVLEFWKENQVEFENLLVLNMGQILSLPGILIGLGLFLGWQNVFKGSNSTEPS